MTNKHQLTLKNRPFSAIIKGTKKIEIRANKNEGSVDYKKIKKGDLILFQNTETFELISCIVRRKSYYKSIRSLLTEEGTKFTLSSTNCIERGIKSIQSISDYKYSIPKHGVFAIEIELRDRF